MYSLKFDPNGDPLRIDIQFHGAITASYIYTLWEANSNNEVDSHQGNNMNSDDDNYKLPTPAIVNEGRIIDIFSTLKNGDQQKVRTVVIVIVFQGDNKLDQFSEDVFIDPKKTEVNEMFIKLTA